MKLRTALTGVAFAASAVPMAPAFAQLIIQDNLAGKSSSLNWQSFSGACLTAGDNTGSIPACLLPPNYTTPMSYYSGQSMTGGFNGTLPDPVGKGALRLTNGAPYYNQRGAVVSNFTFPTGQGIQVTFKTVTYKGDSGGAARDGADGISFFLMDGAQAPNLGAFGGSLGYTCSNSNYPHDGIVGGYIAVGIDEYGNFLNQGDNTASGYGYVPQRIGLRGAGNIAWSWLNKNYPNYYPASLSATDQQTAVYNTCATGHLWDYSSLDPTAAVDTGTSVLDYPAIPNAFKVLSNLKDSLGNPIQLANESANVRDPSQTNHAIPIAYQLSITQDGLLSFSYSVDGGTYQPVISKQSITASNGPLPGSFRFGFAGSTGGSDNIHEILCFRAAPADQAASSAGVNTQKSGELSTGTQVYLAYFHPTNWWGELSSRYLTYNASTNVVSIASTAVWDASCVLTGGTCATTGGTVTAQAPSTRAMLTWNDSTKAGIPFEWANLTSAQQSALDAGDLPPINSNRLSYLRGDRSNEVNSLGIGPFRARTGVLGDIINSSPVWVGPPQAPYGAVWRDSLNPTGTQPENGGQTYPTFASASGAGTRANVVYSGSNDGFVHGFRSGSYDSLGNYSTTSTPNDGLEVLAFMPNAVLQKIHSGTDTTVDFASTQYAHAYSVDATPGTGDAYYSGAWHTLLAGGLGAGGSAIYALDITDPTRFSETNASSLVLGEWTPSSITCSNVTSCGNNLGYTYGTPAIRRLHNGKWAILFGNGFSSSSGTAGMFVILLSSTGTVSEIRFIDTGYGPSRDPLATNRKNGIAYVTPADLDGDHITDYVYAGDVFGNVWRFDLTSSNPSSWAVSSFGGSAGPLFSTPNGQPITTKLAVVSTLAKVGPSRLVVDFGTGSITPQTTTSAAQYSTGTQSLYGIWDWNLTGWNGLGSTQYAALSSAATINTGNLALQSVLATSTIGSDNVRTVSANPVCWSGSTTCASGNTQFGWRFDLPTTGEQVVYNPIIANGALVVNTTIPPSNNATTCTDGLPTGWTMGLSPDTGGAFPTSFFGDASGAFPPVNGGVVGGVYLNGTGSPSVVSANKRYFVVTQTSGGIGAARSIYPPTGTQGKRLTWIEKR